MKKTTGQQTSKTSRISTLILLAVYSTLSLAPLSSRAGSSVKPFDFAAPPGWEATSFFIDNIQMWRREAPNSPTLTILEDRSHPYEPPETNDELLREVRASVYFANHLVGITEWKTKSITRIPVPIGQLVILTGTYREFTGSTVQFEQWKYYTKLGLGQIDYSEASGKGALDHKQIVALLTRYHPCGI